MHFASCTHTIQKIKQKNYPVAIFNVRGRGLKFALNNVIVVRCNLLSFGVNFDKILLDKNIQKRIIFIYNYDIAAARVELWSSSTNV